MRIWPDSKYFIQKSPPPPPPPAPPRLGKKVGENRRENNQINQEKVILSFSQKSAKMQFFTWLKDNCIIIACFYSKIVRSPRTCYIFSAKIIFSSENREEIRNFKSEGVGINKDFWPKYLPLPY